MTTIEMGSVSLHLRTHRRDGVADTRLVRTERPVPGHGRGTQRKPDDSDHAEDDDSGSDAEDSEEAEESEAEEILRASQPPVTNARLARPGANSSQSTPSALTRPAPTAGGLAQPAHHPYPLPNPHGQLSSTSQQQQHQLNNISLDQRTRLFLNQPVDRSVTINATASGRKGTTDVKVDHSQNVYDNQNHSTTDNRVDQRVTNHHHKTVVQNDGELHKQWAEHARSSLLTNTTNLTGCQAEVKRLQRVVAEKDDNYAALWSKCQTVSTAHTKAEMRAGAAEGQVEGLKVELNGARQKGVDQQRRIEWQQRALVAAQGGTLPFDKLERLVRIWSSLTEPG